MVAYVKGNVLAVSDSTVILENNGIGYEILCSSTAFSKLSQAKEGAVYTYLAVREDGISLYGFDDLAEKQMFLKLITVSGVGPKMAMTVLSGMSLNDLAFSIAGSDVSTLSKIKGLGKKTAERIIVELREAMAKLPLTITDVGKAKQPKIELSQEGDNAVMALLSLGYSKQEATIAVKDAVDSGVTKLEDIIRTALKNFVR